MTMSNLFLFLLIAYCDILRVVLGICLYFYVQYVITFVFVMIDTLYLIEVNRLCFANCQNESQNVSTNPSKLKQMRNINTVRFHVKYPA